MSRPTIAKIDLQALRDNFRLAQRLSVNSQLMPMVKADAYGHGAVAVAKALAELAPAFGVACIEEALALREAHIEQPILLLEGTFSPEEITLAAQNNFWLMVENTIQAEAIINAKLEKPLHLWLGIDTGMHRLGFQPEDVSSVYQQLSGQRNIHRQMVLSSHFACADNLSSDATSEQIALFNTCTEGLGNALTSLANSAAILGWPEAQRDWQRPGYLLYGNSPFNVPQSNADQLKPVMCFESAVISLREVKPGQSVGYTANWTAQRTSTIATIAVGYGDGYPRNAPNGTPVLVHGEQCPLAGCVSMDMITVDVSNLTRQVSIGDKVILWGPELSVNLVASHCHSIGYELLTRMPSRVPRLYL